MDFKWKSEKALKFLMDTGLLFKINAEVLHPLGFALGARVDRNSGEKEFGIITSDGDDGLYFDDRGWYVGLEKYEWFLDACGQERIDNRKKSFGFVEQIGPIDSLLRKLGKYDC